MYYTWIHIIWINLTERKKRKKRVPCLQRNFFQVQVIVFRNQSWRKWKRAPSAYTRLPVLKSYPCHDTATIGVLIVIKRYQPVAHITIFCSKLFLSWKKSFVSHLSSSSSFATFFMIVRLVTKISDSLTNTAIPHKMQIYLKESKTNNRLVTSPILWNNLAYQWWYNRKDLRR